MTGGLFQHWKVPTLNMIVTKEKDRLEKLGITKTELTKSPNFGNFNGYGYLRAPYSTNNKPGITRNPGHLANSNIEFHNLE